jgi:hypothetical protein
MKKYRMTCDAFGVKYEANFESDEIAHLVLSALYYEECTEHGKKALTMSIYRQDGGKSDIFGGWARSAFVSGHIKPTMTLEDARKHKVEKTKLEPKLGYHGHIPS